MSEWIFRTFYYSSISNTKFWKHIHTWITCVFPDFRLPFSQNVAQKSRVQICSFCKSEGCKVSIAELDSRLWVWFAQTVIRPTISSCQFPGVRARKSITVPTRKTQIQVSTWRSKDFSCVEPGWPSLLVCRHCFVCRRFNRFSIENSALPEF